MTVALCPLVGEEQQLKLGGIHEVQAAEIDDDALGAFGLGDVELVLQRPRRGQVELAEQGDEDGAIAIEVASDGQLLRWRAGG